MANAITATSGATSFNPSLGEMVLEAFSRIQVRPTSLTSDHFFQARLSSNLLQTEFSNAGMPLLWKIAPIRIPLYPGVTEYAMPANIIAPLDATITQYTQGTPQNFAPVFTADAGSTTMTVTQAGHSRSAGAMTSFNTAVAASGMVIQGPYIVDTVVDENNYQITTAQAADGTNSVALPIFTATAGSSSIAIELPNHGLSLGKSFYCNVQITVGGLNLSGQLIVNGVQDQDNFTVAVGSGASTSGSATLNSGQVQAVAQAIGVDPTDFILYPISRTDYVSQPDKGPNLQFRPTTFWFQRLRNPVISFWNAPDDNGPYIFTLWAMLQPDNAMIEGGTGIDVPYRFLDAYAAGLAARLARKFPPAPASGVTVAELRAEAQDAFQKALAEDIERVPLFISPGLNSYFR